MFFFYLASQNANTISNNGSNPLSPEANVGPSLGDIRNNTCPLPEALQGNNMNCSTKFMCSDVKIITPYKSQICL